MCFQQRDSKDADFWLCNVGNIEIILKPYSKRPKDSCDNLQHLFFLQFLHCLFGSLLSHKRSYDKWHSHKCDSNCNSPSCDLVLITNQLALLRVNMQSFCSCSNNRYSGTSFFSAKPCCQHTKMTLKCHSLNEVTGGVPSCSHLNTHEANFNFQERNSIFAA